MSASRGVSLSSISFAIEGVPPLHDFHCMHTKLMPLFHTAIATFLFELYSCLLFKFLNFLYFYVCCES